jgi:hypothetical protein
MYRITKKFDYRGHRVDLASDGEIWDSRGKACRARHLGHMDGNMGVGQCCAWRMVVEGPRASFRASFAIPWALDVRRPQPDEEAKRLVDEQLWTVGHLGIKRRRRRFTHLDHKVEIISQGTPRNGKGEPLKGTLPHHSGVYLSWHAIARGELEYFAEHLIPVSGEVHPWGESLEQYVRANLAFHFAQVKRGLHEPMERCTETGLHTRIRVLTDAVFRNDSGFPDELGHLCEWRVFAMRPVFTPVHTFEDVFLEAKFLERPDRKLILDRAHACVERHDAVNQ